MRFTNRQTLTWVVVLTGAVTIAFLAQVIRQRSIVQEAEIPPILETSSKQIEYSNSGCDPLVIGMDAEGMVYSGRDRIGSMADIMALKTKMKGVAESKRAQLVYAGGMDLNDEVPAPPCRDYSVFVKSPWDENDRRTIQLISLLEEVGIHPTRIIKDMKKS